jgi:hypothetical protein
MNVLKKNLFVQKRVFNNRSTNFGIRCRIRPARHPASCGYFKNPSEKHAALHKDVIFFDLGVGLAFRFLSNSHFLKDQRLFRR